MIDWTRMSNKQKAYGNGDIAAVDYLVLPENDASNMCGIYGGAYQLVTAKDAANVFRSANDPQRWRALNPYFSKLPGQELHQPNGQSKLCESPSPGYRVYWPIARVWVLERRSKVFRLPVEGPHPPPPPQQSECAAKPPDTLTLRMQPVA